MFERLWRVTLVCSLLVAAVLLTRFLFDVMDPVDPVERFLAQARDDYSETQLPAPLGSGCCGGRNPDWLGDCSLPGAQVSIIDGDNGGCDSQRRRRLGHLRHSRRPRQHPLSPFARSRSAMCQRAFASSATFRQCLCRSWRCLASSSERLAASSEGQSTSSELHKPTAEFGFPIPPVY